MHNIRFLRHQFRSVLAIPGVCAAVGTVYDAAAGELTVSGPVVGLFLGLPLILFEVLFPLQFMRKWPFAASVFARAVLYITLLLLVFSSLTFIYGLAHGLTLNDFYEAVWSSDTVTQLGVGFGAFVVIIFFQQLNRLLDPGTLVRYIFGRYYPAAPGSTDLHVPGLEGCDFHCRAAGRRLL